MLDAVIEFIARFDLILYFVSALGFLFGLRGLAISRRIRRSAAFPLEFEAARAIRRRAVSTIGSMLALAGSIYVVTNVVRPAMANMPLPGSGPSSPPAPDVTPEATNTLPPLLFPTVTPTFGIVAPGEEGEVAATLAPSTGVSADACQIIGVTITNPLPGEVVAGQVQVVGEANILNFGSYKFEINGPSTGSAWVTLATFNVPVASGALGTWDATSLEPGSYLFRLVVTDQTGNFPEPCTIPLSIAQPDIQPVTGTPPAP